MRIFIDTEFSDLSDNAALISLGAISEAGETFYFEVAPLPPGCSAFVHAEVIPHFEHGAFSMSVQEGLIRLVEWLRPWPSAELVMDSDWDIFVIRKAFTNETTREPGPMMLSPSGHEARLTTLTLDTTYKGDGLVAYFDAFYKIEKAPGFRKHHALDDARALRAAVLAAEDAVRASCKPQVRQKCRLDAIHPHH